MEEEEMRKTYWIWKDKNFKLGWFDSSKTFTVKMVIKWNPDRTTVKSATVELSARSDGNTQIELSMNDSSLFTLTWELWEGGVEKSDSSDATGLLRLGINKFTAYYRKGLFYIGEANATVNSLLTIEFEGEEPEVETEWKYYLEKYGLLIATAGAAGVVGALLAGGRKSE